MRGEDNNFKISMNSEKISKIERISILTRLILKYSPNLKTIEAVRLAKDLARVIDELNFFKVNLNSLRKEFTYNFPEHWKKRTEFFLIVMNHWPQILQSLDKKDVDPIFTDL
ncbi:MAG: hypothetical protein LBF70_00735 [Holosporales bacterium]|jgi:inactivated superfamily I helicase|nr:hypothetical protein [Holosporales bacterium]